MSLTRFTTAAVAGILAVGLAATAFAQDLVVDPAIAGLSAEDKVEARQAAMRENGGIVRGIGAMAAAEAATAAGTLAQNLANMPALFAPDTIVGDSRALPLIWEEKEAFDAILAAALGKALEARAAAEGGDVAAAAAAAGAIGPMCGQCHDKYRGS